eukprot:TRINITY_DN135_c2_g1_i1.p1 TRINITY_DN135_c2_g1~~TRINITY_DN135_c2_g1_i1.p1  ORF type:complete len:994 (-),score=327.27 TRINITY_DN135_c2_g1_i1:788-3769(-)
MWILELQSKENVPKRIYLKIGEVFVGRKLISCKTVSRKHAKIIVEDTGVGNIPKVFVIDQSSFGTYVNKSGAKKNVKQELKQGYTVKFAEPIYKLVWKEKICCMSGIDSSEDLMKIIHDCGFKLEQEWNPKASMLITANPVKITRKLILSMVGLVPCVDEKWLRNFASHGLNIKLITPSTGSDFKQAFKDSSTMDLDLVPGRKVLFEGLTFAVLRDGIGIRTAIQEGGGVVKSYNEFINNADINPTKQTTTGFPAYIVVDPFRPKLDVIDSVDKELCMRLKEEYEKLRSLGYQPVSEKSIVSTIGTCNTNALLDQTEVSPVTEVASQVPLPKATNMHAVSTTQGVEFNPIRSNAAAPGSHRLSRKRSRPDDNDELNNGMTPARVPHPQIPKPERKRRKIEETAPEMMENTALNALTAAAPMFDTIESMNAQLPSLVASMRPMGNINSSSDEDALMEEVSAIDIDKHISQQQDDNNNNNNNNNQQSSPLQEKFVKKEPLSPAPPAMPIAPPTATAFQNTGRQNRSVLLPSQLPTTQQKQTNIIHIDSEHPTMKIENTLPKPVIRVPELSPIRPQRQQTNDNQPSIEAIPVSLDIGSNIANNDDDSVPATLKRESSPPQQEQQQLQPDADPIPEELPPPRPNSSQNQQNQQQQQQQQIQQQHDPLPPAPKQEKKKKRRRKVKKEVNTFAKAIHDDPLRDKVDVGKITVKELKQFLRNHGQGVSGLKKVLLERAITLIIDNPFDPNEENEEEEEVSEYESDNDNGDEPNTHQPHIQQLLQQQQHQTQRSQRHSQRQSTQHTNNDDDEEEDMDIDDLNLDGIDADSIRVDDVKTEIKTPARNHSNSTATPVQNDMSSVVTPFISRAKGRRGGRRRHEQYETDSVVTTGTAMKPINATNTKSRMADDLNDESIQSDPEDMEEEEIINDDHLVASELGAWIGDNGETVEVNAGVEESKVSDEEREERRKKLQEQQQIRGRGKTFKKQKIPDRLATIRCK